MGSMEKNTCCLQSHHELGRHRVLVDLELGGDVVSRRICSDELPTPWAVALELDDKASFGTSELDFTP